MFHNISNPKWFGNWSRLEDDYLGNGGTDIADNSSMVLSAAMRNMVSTRKHTKWLLDGRKSTPRRKPRMRRKLTRTRR